MKYLVIILSLILISCSNPKNEYSCSLDSPKNYIVDRVEGNIIVLLDGRREKKVNRSILNQNITEGKKVVIYKDRLEINNNYKLKDSIEDLQDELSQNKLAINL